ncbi:MAG TPA: family 1 glycosylhydrolase [Terracidiphilus sp.]
MGRAIADGAIEAFMDKFEWTDGYSQRCGLTYVNLA